MNSQAETSLGRYRLRLLAAAFLVIALGVASRTIWAGSLLWDKYVGDAAYAAIFYLALSLVWAKGPVPVKAMLTSGYVVAIELFQLTQVPAQLNQSDSFVIRAFAYVVLGSAFSWWDLLAYGVGIVGILLLDRAIITPLRIEEQPGDTPAGGPYSPDQMPSECGHYYPDVIRVRDERKPDGTYIRVMDCKYCGQSEIPLDIASLAPFLAEELKRKGVSRAIREKDIEKVRQKELKRLMKDQP